MTMRGLLGSLVVLLVLPRFAVAQDTNHTGRGAALGGVAGALAGAAIGKNNHNTTAGALIGGAAGLIGGAAIGNGMDEKNRIRTYQQRQQSYAMQQAYAVQQAVSLTDVLTLTRNGVSPDVIINQVRQRGISRPLDVNDIITLHNEGVNESVIAAMQQCGGPAVPAAPVYARPVIVEEYRYAPPCYHPHGHYPYPYRSVYVVPR